MRVVGVNEDYHLKSWDLKFPHLETARFRDVSNPNVHLSFVETALEILRTKGGVGRDLYELATDSSCPLDIVCWPGVPGEFISDAEIPDCPTPTILWDPYKIFQYFSRARPNSKEGALCTMPAWAVLGHELGHYCHYQDDSKWFQESLSEGPAQIELENLVDHEQPLLAAADLPIRRRYMDFVGSGQEPKRGPDIAIRAHKDNLTPAVPARLNRPVEVLQAAVDEAKRRALLVRQHSSQLVRQDSLFEKICDLCKKSFGGTVSLMVHREECQKSAALERKRSHSCDSTASNL